MRQKKLSAAERFTNLVEKQKQDGSFQVDGAKLEISEQIFQEMESKNISEAEFSRKLGVSRAYINKILQGDTNFTIETLVKIGIALNAEFKFEFVTREIEDDITDADIIYIEDEPIVSSNISSPSSLYNFKANIFHDFEAFKLGKSDDILVHDLQFS